MTQIARTKPSNFTNASLALMLAFLGLIVPLARAESEPDQSGDWTARWIGLVAGEPVSTTNLWLAFRKTFELTNAPDRVTARIAADSKYWLWVNGELVVREGGLKRGPTPQDTYYDEVDLSHALRPGSNTVALLVWYFGKHGFSHKSSGQAGLVFEAELGGSRLISDATWKARVHPAFGNTDAPHPNFRLPESNLRFDARKDLGDWTGRDFDDTTWPPAAEFGVPPVAPWNQLVKRPIPLWRDFGLRAYAHQEMTATTNPVQLIRARLPYNAQVTPYFKIEAAAGLRVDIRADNYKGGGAPNVRAEYVTRAGVQEFEGFGWMNGHEVHYTFPKEVRILDLKYRETGYDTDLAGHFASSDPQLDQLWQEAARTLYITMRDTYMDCPDRERAQWWGDVVIEMGEAFYALDPRSHQLARKGILELMNWQRPDGTIFSPVPAGNWDKELTQQMLASVGWYGFWTYYLHSGDAETIRQVYARLKTYLDVWKLGDDGLVVPRPGGWEWGDWGENQDMRILYNGWFYLALKGQRELAKVAGHADDVPAIEARMASIQRKFNDTFWNGTAYRSPDYKGQTDDRAQAIAVVAGLARPEHYAAIREVLRTQRHASPYMEKYVLEALIQMGLVDDALERMKSRYRVMLEDNLTTLYEGWGVGKEGFGGGTYNHAWSGGPLTLLSQYIAGFTPLKPGYASYEVRPQLGSLKEVSASVPSVRGIIKVTIHKTANELNLELEAPPGAEAFVVLPKLDADRLTANGKEIWPATKSSSAAAAGVRLVDGAEKTQLRLQVAPGRWRFTLTQSSRDAATGAAK